MTDLDGLADGLADRLRPGGEQIGDDALQRLFAAVVRRYASRVVEDGATSLPPVAAEAGTTATEALVAAGGLLRATEVSSFELANMFNL
ncbi:MAG: hypothetical protein FJW96_00490 [Actinobacteria bacterium]|nr:hypothetical protein [Actinomycetota bacterium]